MKLTDALQQSFPNAYEWQRRKESRKMKAYEKLGERGLLPTVQLSRKEFKKIYPDIRLRKSDLFITVKRDLP